MKPPNSLSLDSILDEPVPFAFDLHFSAKALDREPLLEVSPVLLEGEVSRIEKGFAFDARLSYGGRLECSRCLASYPFEAREDFSLVLRKRKAPAGVDVLLQSEDLNEYFYDDPVIAVAPIAEERIQMAVPMKPLCRDDCRGLCPQCGVNRNTGTCECGPGWEDPRLAGLKGLIKGTS